MSINRKTDLLIVGGGVIGLSIAYELAKRGLQITLVERGRVGSEASWAGAGMLPPGSWYSGHRSLEEFAETANELYPIWSRELYELSGIENEYWICGARYDKTPNTQFAERLKRWSELGVEVEDHNDHYWVPGESQIRNPRHIKALHRSCLKLGVTIQQGSQVLRVETPGRRLTRVSTTSGNYEVDSVVIAAGCWSSTLANQLGLSIPSRPLRGQMLLLRPKSLPFNHIVHRHPYYLVPRRDGLLLVGATVEHVGFDRRTTEEAFQELIQFSRSVHPMLGVGKIEGFWSGLRPDSLDGLPAIGQLPELENVWIATGHSRAGLQFAPPTAKLIAAQVMQEGTPVSAEAFSPARFCCPASLSC